MAETEMKRHPLAIAWDEWLASDEGREASNVDTLARYTDRYLENRLKRAFDAGAKAATLSPSDFEQLIRLRKAARSLIEAAQFSLSTPGLIRGRDQLTNATEAASCECSTSSH